MSEKIDNENMTENMTKKTEDITVENTSVETPAEISTNDVSIIIEQTFIDLVKKSLETEEMKKKFSIPLTPEVISTINNIINLTPNILTDIEKAMVETIKDGKIDSKDIPNLIIIIQSLYQFIYSLKDLKFDAKKRADMTASSLKFILHLLVLERKIKIDEEDQEMMLSQINALIDSCISLLSYSKSLKPKRCFKKIFGYIN
jgi:hypothetical protein